MKTEPRRRLSHKIVLLPGDGVGPEVCAAARVVLDRVAPGLSYESQLIGGAAIDATGGPLPQETIDACLGSDAVLLGAVGGPRWDAGGPRPEAGLLDLRRALGVFANLRPVRVTEALAECSPLRPERVVGTDILFVRELTGGIYFGEPRAEAAERAFDTMVYTAEEVRRVVDLACGLAETRSGKLTSVDKANVLGSSRLWRRVAAEVAAEHPEVELENQLVDSCATRIISDPKSFDVVVTGNLFGDILTDEAAVLPGSLGVLPSAALGVGGPGLFEPVHGSAPDIAGQGVANPTGTILSAALLLRYGLGLADEAAQIEAAVDAALESGARTRDLGGELGTQAMCEAILARL